MTSNTPKTPPPMPELTGDETAVILFTAENNADKPFHAYIKLTLKKLVEFQEAQQRNAPIDLNTLGEVIHTGWGHDPDPEIHAEIVAEHGEVLEGTEE